MSHHPHQQHPLRTGLVGIALIVCGGLAILHHWPHGLLEGGFAVVVGVYLFAEALD